MMLPKGNAMRRLLHVTVFTIALCACNLLLIETALADIGRAIVKFRSESTIQALESDSSRMNIMGAHIGLKVVASRALIGRMHAVSVEGVSSDELATQLTMRADVEYAVPDKRKFIRTMPTDSLYARQWYLQSTEVAATNAQTAWDTTTGSSSVVVAVLDTGILANHPDLTDKLTYNGGTLYGYDFVSGVARANDGDGRDTDPSDPGDWVTSSDTATGEFRGCSVENSSWHGSMVAGIIAANSNNSIGIAGVSWGAKILPVRVLGKCGGYDSDIIAGMLWAAGLPVNGVSKNIYPAKIINMSLGSADSCNAAYQDTVDQLLSAGSIVAAAAGNDSTSVGSPANCSGVLAVTALRNAGTKVGYSNYGAAAGIAAPGGNCVSSGVCQYPFYSTGNSGVTVPSINTYSSATDAEVGTSFASPLVAGVAALMRSVNSSLTPSLLVSRLKSSSSAFPRVVGVASCSAMAPGTGTECNCSTNTCGAGMVNAANAVNEALRPEAVISSVISTTAGSSIGLSSTASTAADGHQIVSYHWTSSDGTLSGVDQASAALWVSNAGTVTVTLTVADDAGKTDSTTSTIIVTAGVPGAPTSCTAIAGNTGATVSFDSPSFTGGASIIRYTVTSNPGGLHKIGTSSPITVTGLTNGTAYTFTVTATNAVGTGPASRNSNSVIPKYNQTITFANPGAQTFGTSPTLSATSSSGFPVSFTSATPNICTVSMNGVLTFVTTDTCTINANQNGDSNYSPATQVQQSFMVNKSIQTITFGPIPSIKLGDADMVADAIVSTGQPLTFFSSNDSVASIINGKIHPVSVGTCVITATQVGNANYLAASSTQTLTVEYNTTPPHLIVSALSNNAITSETTHNVSGMALDPSGIKTLFINDTAVTLNHDGSFSFPIQLIAGANDVKIIVTSNAGIGTTEIRTLTLDSSAPHLAVSYPPDNGTVMQPFVTVAGNLSEKLYNANTTTKSAASLNPVAAISYSVNGSARQNATHSNDSYSFTANLVEGMNTINIFALAATGVQAEMKRTITYQPAFSLVITDPATDIRTPFGLNLVRGSFTGNTSPVIVTINVDNQIFTPQLDGATFQQQLNFTDDKVYQIFITGVDQNNNSLTVQRNIIHSIGKADSGSSSHFTITDALQALMISMGTTVPTTSQIRRLDMAPMVNGVSVGDGKVDMEDVIVILRMAVGLI